MTSKLLKLVSSVPNSITGGYKNTPLETPQEYEEGTNGWASGDRRKDSTIDISLEELDPPLFKQSKKESSINYNNPGTPSSILLRNQNKDFYQALEIDASYDGNELTEKPIVLKWVAVDALASMLPKVKDDKAKIKSIAEAMKKGVGFPPIVVEGERVVDGYNRIKAAELLELGKVPTIDYASIIK